MCVSKLQSYLWSTLLELLRLGVNSLRFLVGYTTFLVTGTTPKFATRALAHLSSFSNGRLNDILSWFISIRHPSGPVKDVTGVLGDLKKKDIEEIVDVIREKGYYVFDKKLSQELCDKLLSFALTTPCTPMKMSNTDKLDAFGYVPEDARLYERDNPISVRYDFVAQDLMQNPVIQDLIIDPAFLAIAENYLRSKPITDMNSMWWSNANFGDEGSSSAGQFYHADLDRIRFFKFFVYLSDVDHENGPHCFVEGSHKKKPRSLLRGSKRVSDNEMKQHYSADKLVELIGKRGTIVAVDNIGFHKGKPLLNGDRLILQILYENSCFGASYIPIEINEYFQKDFIDYIQKHPRLVTSHRCKI